jgi:hypothetical protein
MLILILIISATFVGYFAWRDTNNPTIKIEWTTASEIDTVGFDIYRSLYPDKDFIQVNQELVPASQDPLTGSDYSYIDENVIPGTVYYYLLEDVNIEGIVTRNGPIEIKAETGSKIYFSVALLFVIGGCLLGIWWIRKKY